MRQTDEYLEALSDGILRQCLGPYSSKLASGEQVNNRLNLEMLRLNPDLYDRVVTAAGAFARELFESNKPTLIVPVPDGANPFGRDLARNIGTSCALLDKDPATGQVTAGRDTSQIIQKEGERVLVADSVVDQGANTQKVVTVLGELGAQVDSVLCIWDRGDPWERTSKGLPTVHSLISEYMPPIMPDDSPYSHYVSATNNVDPPARGFFANTY